jgi:hypothetical protein
MAFTNDNETYINTTESSQAEKLSVDGNDLNSSPSDILNGKASDVYSMFEPGDCQLVIHYFEINAANEEREDYAHVVHYRDVYSTENFSHRVREQMAYYPGMHSAGAGGTGPGPNEDPFQTNAQKLGDKNLNYWNEAMSSPEDFMTGLQGAQADLDYTEMFKGDSKNVTKNIASAITECIPCFDRILDGAQLLPDGDLLEIHALNIKMRTDLLDKLKGLFNNPGFNVDICQLLEYFTHLCPSDILAIIALLSQYLAKLNLDFSFNLNLIIELIGPILSPFLDGLTQWLDKWVQLILGPLICVVDHINMTIYTAQQFKLPLSEAQVNTEANLGAALPFQFNASSQDETNLGLGARYDAFDRNGYDPETGEPLINDGRSYNSFFETKSKNKAFETPDVERYNPEVPNVPIEEVELALAEIKYSSTKNTEANSLNAYDQLSAEERQSMWHKIKTEYWEDENVDRPPPLRDVDNRDGTRWSPDDQPQSEKDFYASKNVSYNTSAYPPEKQAKPKDATDYYIDAGVIVDPIIQMRNIMVAGIRYMQDWFTWATQLIYDLIGTDFGWMKKKMDNTILKSRIIQLLMMLKAIIEAIDKNGLKCGTRTNFDSGQLRFILEEVMSKNSPYEFKARPDGTFEMTLSTTGTGSASGIETANGINQSNALSQAAAAEQNIFAGNEQNYIGSGIIIKDCLKKVKESEASKVREWIADFERRSDG